MTNPVSSAEALRPAADAVTMAWSLMLTGDPQSPRRKTASRFVHEHRPVPDAAEVERGAVYLIATVAALGLPQGPGGVGDEAARRARAAKLVERATATPTPEEAPAETLAETPEDGAPDGPGEDPAPVRAFLVDLVDRLPGTAADVLAWYAAHPDASSPTPGRRAALIGLLREVVELTDSALPAPRTRDMVDQLLGLRATSARRERGRGRR
ncbi:hypothetical protein ACN20G_27855 (plasmid) [Streptomyces sp. BI20]|uniref:hypothetical protein n=1 Tax=Streptomyces sp. BI20 TaxID=3403460 RepID=UPI003C78DDEA